MSYGISEVRSRTDSPKKRGARLLGILALILFVANLVHFLTRGWEDSYYPVSYSTIYFPTDRPVIREWRWVEGGVEAVVKWDAEVTGWKLLKNGEVTLENSGKAIFFPTYKNQTDYQYFTAVALPEGLFPPFPIKFRYLPEEFHEAQGLPRDDFVIVMTDEPMADFEQFSVDHWVDTYDYLNEQDLELVDSIIRDKAGISKADPVFAKLEKLMIHLREELGQACRGTPPPDFRWKNPLQIYLEMRDGTGQGWCTQ